MIKMARKRGRLSIDVLLEERRRIKAYAALHGITIREYVLQSIHEKMRQEAEQQDLWAMTTQPGSVLKELWDNPKDASYDKV